MVLKIHYQMELVLREIKRYTDTLGLTRTQTHAHKTAQTNVHISLHTKLLAPPPLPQQRIYLATLTCKGKRERESEKTRVTLKVSKNDGRVTSSFVYIVHCGRRLPFAPHPTPTPTSYL